MINVTETKNEVESVWLHLSIGGNAIFNINAKH